MAESDTTEDTKFLNVAQSDEEENRSSGWTIDDVISRVGIGPWTYYMCTASMLCKWLSKLSQ